VVDHASTLAALKATWDAWTETGKNAGPEMRNFIKQMWMDAGGVKMPEDKQLSIPASSMDFPKLTVLAEKK
jgi:hypothetical protein